MAWLTGRLTRRRVLIGGGGLLLAGLGADTARQLRQGGYEAALARMTTRLPETPTLADLLRYATLAANGHNTQPWRFAATETGVRLHPDLLRRTPVVDPDDHHLFASLGCAAETLAIAARDRGRGGVVAAATPETGLEIDLTPGVAEAQALMPAIPLRQSTRGLYDGSRLDAAQTARLVAAAARHGVEARVIADPPGMEALLALVQEGNRAQIADPAFLVELKEWLRFNPVAAARSGDGLFTGASGNPSLPDWLGPRVFDLVFSAGAENEKYAAQVRSSAALLVLVAPENTPRGWVAAGRAAQRLMLQATRDGLKCAFLNQAVEVPEVRAELQAHLGLGDRRPNLVLRVGRGPALPRSLRRPVAAVYDS
ncbi:Acg family FMN-binding oxidoreductase [Pseudodonghicola flavimaris]|uniref:Nitroreductase family protein n=1 Tax=Pseudodonghicola flavimaris TaxID=3050036 RepID=A0ABT7EZ92_9RHOB|nr:nitroreductase family protein [Pseudodonghicola flavimaris]MDK3017671.1 nitroreductase family protein [Pseudodonghicola flavimaris]